MKNRIIATALAALTAVSTMVAGISVTAVNDQAEEAIVEVVENDTYDCSNENWVQIVNTHNQTYYDLYYTYIAYMSDNVAQNDAIEACLTNDANFLAAAAPITQDQITDAEVPNWLAAYNNINADIANCINAFQIIQ